VRAQRDLIDHQSGRAAEGVDELFVFFAEWFAVRCDR